MGPIANRARKMRNLTDYSDSMPSTDDNTPNSPIELQTIDDHPRQTNAKLSYRSLFSFTTSRHAFPLSIAVIFSILSSLLKPASAIIFGRLFSVFTKYGRGDLNTQQTIQQVSLWCIVLAAIGGATWVSEGVFLSQWMIFGELQAKVIRQEMFEGLLGKNMEWYDLRQDGIETLVVRIQTQIRELQMSVSQPLGLLIFEMSAIVTALIVGFVSSWELTLVIIAAFPVAAFFLWLVSRNLGGAIEAQKRNLTTASKFANTAFTSIDTVKAFNGQDQEEWQYLSAIKEVAKSYLFQARANAMQFGVLKFFTICTFVQGFWYGIFLVRRGLDSGNVITTFYACLTALQAVEVILPQWLVLTKGMSAGETLRQILMEIQDKNNREAKAAGCRPYSCSGDIEVNAVTFAYPSNPGNNVLNNTAFFFPAGETTYIVGKSGSGKSTLGNILLKYYESYTGNVMIDGQDIRGLNTQWLRENITLVQQQSILFNDSIFQNIALGKSSSASGQEVWQAAKTADLEKTISELPDGLSTLVGSNGKSLSGGQQQRIALARARLRNSPVLILDEATSALDQQSRDKVNQQIREWRKGKTTIVITHDVTQILDDEYVYIMENGVVVQEGYCKGLKEQTLGPFASFVPTQDPRQDNSRQQPKTSLPYPPVVDSPALDTSHRWSFIPSIFGSDSPYLAPGAFGGIAGSRLSGMSVGAAHINALRSDVIWSTPRNLEDERRSSIPTTKSPPQPFRNFATVTNESEKSQIIANYDQDTGRNNSHLQQTYTDPVSDIRQRASHEIKIDVPFKSTAPKATTTTLKDVFGTIWPTLTSKQRCILILGCCCCFIIGSLTPAFAYVFALLLSVFYASYDQLREARTYSSILIGIALLDGLASFAAHFSLEYVGQSWINALRVEALKCVLAQPKSWFDRDENAASRLNEVLDRNAEEMRNLLGRFAGPVFTAFWMITISTVWAVTISWKLTLVSLSTAPVMYLATRIFDYVSTKWEDRCNICSTEASTIFNEAFTNIRVVRALTLEDHFRSKHDAATMKVFKTGRIRGATSGALFGLTDSLSFFIAGLIFYYGAKLFVEGDVSVDEVLQVIQLLMFGIGNASAALVFIPQINSSRTTATQILRLVRLPMESHETLGERRLSTPFPITMNNLSFTYPSRSGTRALSNINLHLEPGTCTALVGPSGSGKSTIASILLSLYPPDSSVIPALTFSHVPVSSCNTSSLRAFMSVVPQQPHLFPTTILSNILYGLPEDHPLATLDNAKSAAQDAGVHDFIMSLDQGYHTLIGEGGMGLSGGQAQRVAIARAMIRKPSVLVLDEATSALDAISAEVVRDMVGRFLEGAKEEGQQRCVVTISHGVEMMKIADEIVVIEGGRIVERGGFEELMDDGCRFSVLVGSKGDGQERDPGKRESVGLGLNTPVDPSGRLTWRDDM